MVRERGERCVHLSARHRSNDQALTKAVGLRLENYPHSNVQQAVGIDALTLRAYQGSKSVQGRELWDSEFVSFDVFVVVFARLAVLPPQLLLVHLRWLRARLSSEQMSTSLANVIQKNSCQNDISWKAEPSLPSSASLFGSRSRRVRPPRCF